MNSQRFVVEKNPLPKSKTLYAEGSQVLQIDFKLAARLGDLQRDF